MPEPGRTGAVTKTSPRSVPDTVARLQELLAAKGLKILDVIDQRAEAPLAQVLEGVEALTDALVGE